MEEEEEGEKKGLNNNNYRIIHIQIQSIQSICLLIYIFFGDPERQE
jgi:hypothetical protein